jgi:hypothetical protein
VKRKHTGTEPFKTLCWMCKAQVQEDLPPQQLQTQKDLGKLFFSFKDFFTKTYRVNKGDQP